MSGVAERGGQDTAYSGPSHHEAGGRQGRTKGTFTRHSRKYVFFFFWIQLAVEVVRVFLYLDTAGSRGCEGFSLFGYSWQ